MQAGELRKLVQRHTLPCCLLFGALCGILLKQDASWDLRNYHLYNAWALLHGRLAIDLAAAGMQSYFNPVLDLPYFLLGTGPLAHLPRILAGLQGCWYGALVFVLLRIAAALAVAQGRTFGVADLLAVLLGASGTMTVSQAGLSSNEMPLALLVLTAVSLLLPVAAGGAGTGAMKRVLLAGLLCGLAAGMKPTAIVYPPALACALVVAGGWRGQAWRQGLLFGIAATCGFLVAYGWWGWMLYRLTGNPVFPLFNQFFHSDWVPAASGTDGQFLPRSLGQWLFYPLYWAHANQGVVTEVRFADPRYALGLCGLMVLAVTSWIRREQVAGAGARTQRLLVAFVVVAYVAWLVLFSILRYAIPIEVLTGLLMLMAVQGLLRCFRAGSARLSSGPAWCMAGLLMVTAAGSRYPNWGHVGYADSVFDVHAPAIEPGSLVLVVGQPLAYLIPFIGQAQASRFVGLTWFNQGAEKDRLGDLVREQLREHTDTTHVLLDGGTGPGLEALRKWLPEAALGQCVRISSGLERYPRDGVGAQLCRVSRQPPRRVGA